MSNSLWPHEPQHSRPPCLSPTPGVYANSCPLSQWYHLTNLVLCHPLLLPSIFPNIRVFSNESALPIRWPKYWSFGFNISPSNEHPGPISLRMYWLDLLAVQVTLKSLLKSNQYYFIINHNKCMRYLLSHFSYEEIKASDLIRSVTQSCPTLCDPMNRSTPDLPVHHQLPEFTQTHVHRVGDAIQPYHPVIPFSSFPQSLPASGSFPMNQLFALGGQSTGVSASASFLPKKSQGWSPSEWTERHYLKLLICWLPAAGFELKHHGNVCFYEV